MVRGDDGVPQRDVDPLRADRRHRVGRVADQEETRQRPAHQPVADDVQQEGMRDRAELSAQVGRQVGRHVRRHLLHPALDAAPAELSEGALVDHPADLEPPVVGREEEREVPGAEVGARRRPVGEERRERHLAPDDVERLRRALLVQSGPHPDHGGAPVGTDDEVGPQLPAVRLYADHAVAVAEQVAHRDAALEPEGRVARRLADQHLQQRRLGHDARALGAQLRRDEPGDASRAAIYLHGGDAGLRQGVEGGAEPHLCDRVGAARHQALAPELACEVPVALEERDGDPAPGEEEGERRARRSGAHHDDVSHAAV